jgi:hypothetical protein
MYDVRHSAHDEGRVSATSTIDPQFKLVFLATGGGTLFLLVICVTSSFLMGPEPRPFFEKVVEHLLDLTKMGFGAVAGLLGEKRFREAVLRQSGLRRYRSLLCRLRFRTRCAGSRSD